MYMLREGEMTVMLIAMNAGLKRIMVSNVVDSWDVLGRNRNGDNLLDSLTKYKLCAINIFL